MKFSPSSTKVYFIPNHDLLGLDLNILTASVLQPKQLEVKGKKYKLYATSGNQSHMKVQWRIHSLTPLVAETIVAYMMEHFFVCTDIYCISCNANGAYCSFVLYFTLK